MRICSDCKTWRGETSETFVHKRGTYCSTCGTERVFDQPLDEDHNEIQQHTMKKKLKKMDSFSEAARKRLRVSGS